MVDIFSLVFPIFALIALGYILVVSGLIPKEVGAALSKFVFSVPLPLLMFRSLATSNIGDQAPWSLWGAYFLCVFSIWALGMLVIRFVFGREGSVLAVAGISSGFSNLVLLGIPIISGVFGEDALVPLVMLLTIHLPVMMLASSLMVETYGREKDTKLDIGAALQKVFKGLVRNPIVVGILAGGLWGLMGLPIPTLAAVVIDKIVPVTVPLALISMGMSMREYGLRGDVVPALVLGLLKTVAFPALFLLVSTTIFSLPAEWVAVIILGAACPTGVNAYLLADHFGVGHRLSANTISLSVLMGFITLPFWISVARDLMVQ
ncbi:AEC family transporter [Cohaesibacter celericrescens]|uniref:AEC family transporter n=1 Tax=Cohaesibacter celericrescens TaxID=2067669 RepID=A0A2N5XUE3_9HYPH|nr:AEC family transporter [Cohaesibacter celericrescens]PLW78077.1 AEC family transporter [Cohaesibacter celericrescens]